MVNIEPLSESFWEAIKDKIDDERLVEQEEKLTKFIAVSKTDGNNPALASKIEHWLSLKKQPQNPKHFNEILYGNRSFRNPFLLKSLVKMYNIDEKKALRSTLLDHPLGFHDVEKNVVSDAVSLLNPPPA